MGTDSHTVNRIMKTLTNREIAIQSLTLGQNSNYCWINTTMRYFNPHNKYTGYLLLLSPVYIWEIKTVPLNLVRSYLKLLSIEDWTITFWLQTVTQDDVLPRKENLRIGLDTEVCGESKFWGTRLWMSLITNLK